MASEALRRAVAAAEVYYSLTPSGAIRNGLRAALDLTDEAQVEAVAKAMRLRFSNSTPWEDLGEVTRRVWRADARAAIAALRDHICGEDTDAP